MESFYTIQGEGFYQGRAAYFIRLGGCDVGCVWCDVKDSWDAAAHPSYSVEEIISKALNEVGGNAKNIIAVITGGEPLMYNLDALTNGLHKAGFQINIETSGAYTLSGNIDWICLSPKKFKEPLPEVIAKAQELKIIIYNKSDFAWAEKYAAQTPSECKLYLQPEWSKEKQMLPLMIDYIKQHPKWELSVQIHKYINVP
ncbi:7-carboxy-7-deazaguanine synthase QueE [Arachidicoccus soli]|uniref:7-carboxy-7-deazaguanine synthase n=1 Tax=Arachidicoccus soli TaxID=2341117 RepID=A0A386HTK5_9BACT|nr:7-carboxy-7-deazaguanine synthase QueE [Arachidicoccus soli]AYD48750.1 7-carboxy-7-deazaguanine synthase QueE [Arachidicoccus soli]